MKEDHETIQSFKKDGKENSVKNCFPIATDVRLANGRFEVFIVFEKT